MKVHVKEETPVRKFTTRRESIAGLIHTGRWFVVYGRLKDSDVAVALIRKINGTCYGSGHDLMYMDLNRGGIVNMPLDQLCAKLSYDNCHVDTRPRDVNPFIEIGDRISIGDLIVGETFELRGITWKLLSKCEGVDHSVAIDLSNFHQSSLKDTEMVTYKNVRQLDIAIK